MYDALAIANYFLDLAKADGKRLDPMQVQKLVYFAHGWNLAIKNEPLVSERVQAWRYGPVIPSVYHAFKKYGNGTIEGNAAECQLPQESWFTQGWSTEIPFSIRDNGDEQKNQFTERLLERVWRAYGGFSGIQLSNITHEPGSPWDKAWNGSGGGLRSSVIGDDVIREYFMNQSREHAQAGV